MAINNSPQQYSETGKHEDLAAYPRLEDARNQVSRVHKAPHYVQPTGRILSSIPSQSQMTERATTSQQERTMKRVR